jgi:uncharacterized membrane protein YphA (DoxX/SURF4 family)
MHHINTTQVSGEESLLRSGLWLAQALLAGVYLLAGTAALTAFAPRDLTLAPWVGYLPAPLVIFFSIVDVAAGLGVLLPSLTRIAPGLSVTAAVCSAVFQLCVIVFFVVLDSPAVMFRLDVSVLALSVFVAWGRSDKAKITSRWRDRRMEAIDAFAGEPIDKPEGRARTCRRMARSRKRNGTEDLRIRRGLRAAPFHRAKEEEPRQRVCPNSTRL